MRDKLADINLAAARYFRQRLLEREDVQRYVHQRISPDTARRFGIGFAPERGLIRYLDRADVEFEDAAHLGLLWRASSRSYEPVFRNRIMVPIIHARMVAGFVGRIFGPGNQAKYINSKASELYNKSEVLYGLAASRKYIQRAKLAIVVEGYFDFLSLFDGGVRNVVALGGIGLTPLHTLQLLRYCSEVCVMLDGDAAGKKATERTLGVLRKAKLRAGVATLPAGMDPDEYLAKYGRDKFYNLVEKRTS